MLWVVIIALLAVLIVYLIGFVTKYLQYWPQRGLTNWRSYIWADPRCPEYFTEKSYAECVKDAYEEDFDERYTGWFFGLQPMWVIRDLKIVESMFGNDADSFTDAEFGTSRTRSIMEPLLKNLDMQAIFKEVSQISKEFAYGTEETSTPIKKTFTRLTHDLLASVLLGTEHDPESKENEKFFRTSAFLLDVHNVFHLGPVVQDLGKLYILKFLGMVKEPRSLVRDLFLENAPKNVKNGKTFCVPPNQNNNLNGDKHGRKLSESEPGDSRNDLNFLAEAALRSFSTFKSISSAMCFMAYELANHPEEQRKLQEEIDQIKKDQEGSLTYETISKMCYLDMVVSEVLRKWPVVFFMNRICTKPYNILARNIMEKSAQILEGDLICIPIFGIHRDRYCYPGPDNFDPQRFNEENKSKLKEFSYMPFGRAPKNCLGSHLTKLLLKVVFFHFLSKFCITLKKRDFDYVITKKEFNMSISSDCVLMLETRENYSY